MAGAQTILANAVAIFGIVPDFALIIILLVVWREDFPVAFPVIMLLSLIADALLPELFGISAAIRFALAAIAYELRQHLNLDQLSSRFYVLLGAEAVYQLIYQLVANGFDLGIVARVYLETSLPTLLYTAAVGFIVFLVFDLEFSIDIRRRRLD